MSVPVCAVRHEKKGWKFGNLRIGNDIARLRLIACLEILALKPNKREANETGYHWLGGFSDERNFRRRG